MKNVRNEILEKADKMGIKIFGLENVPWIVQGRPLFDFDGVDSSLIRTLGQNPGDLFESQGIMNIAIFEDGRVEGLRTVSSQYKLLQHLDAINMSLDNVPEKFELDKIDIITSPNGGRVFANMESKLSSEIVPGDKVKFRATMQNSADTSKVMRFVSGAYRLVCSNGMVAPDSRFKAADVRKMHKGTLDFHRDCKGFFDSLDESVAAIDDWKRYADVKLTAPAMEDVFKSLKVGPRVQDEILKLSLRGQENSLDSLLESDHLTAWDAYNAFTQRITDSNSLEAVKIESGTKVSTIFDKLVKTA